MNIICLFNDNVDLKYRDFQAKICKTKYPILGIKIPIIRKIAKQLLKEYSYEEIISNLGNMEESFESVMLEGLVIANASTSYSEKLNLITNYLSKIDNWANCDIFGGELKFIKKYQDEFFKYLNNFWKMQDEYYLRFGIVILLNYYINEKYLDNVLAILLNIKSDYYYVKMAISWCLSICLVKYYNETLKFLKKNRVQIDPWIYNKTIQKACESYRLTNKQKDELKKMKS